MIISEIKRQKNKSNRVSIYLDGKYSFSLDYETFNNSHLHIGDTVSEEQRELLLQQDEFPRTRDYAFTLLSYRDRTEYELKRRLLDKGFHVENVRIVIKFLNLSLGS